MLLSCLLTFLVFSLILFFLIPESESKYLKELALFLSSFVFIISCFLLFQFKVNFMFFQYLTNYTFGLDLLNIYFIFGLDGTSILFFTLSSLLVLGCIVFILNETDFKEYAFLLLTLELLLLLVFSVIDVLLFYIFFESILIPMYLMIGIWGSRERKIRAVYLFFFYTLIGSMCFLLALIYILCIIGCLHYEILLTYKFSTSDQYWLWLAFFLSFASKIPLFPFHLWLPEAHVEASTVGSVLLAGILLKLGVYGFLRFSLLLFPEASIFFSPFIYTLGILGILFASLTAIRQTDLKRIIAYSSIAHMNLVTLGIFSFNILGIEGAIIQSISHGFVSGAMFFLIGMLYSRYHSRTLHYYGGLTHMMPVYSSLFLLFTMANIALPGSSSFVGEFLLLGGIFKTNIIVCFFAALGVILCGGYSLWLFNRMAFGNLKINYTLFFQDLNFKEFSILVFLLVLVIQMGIYPAFFFNFINLACVNTFILTFY